MSKEEMNPDGILRHARELEAQERMKKEEAWRERVAELRGKYMALFLAGFKPEQAFTLLLRHLDDEWAKNVMREAEDLDED